MQLVKASVIGSRGTPYEVGVDLGNQLKESPLYGFHLERRKKSRNSYATEMSEVRDLFMHYDPSLWEEINGFAEGIGWSLEETVHEYSGYQADWPVSGCSALAKDGIYVRNYDFHPKTYEGRLLLTQTEGAYSSIGFSGRGIGRIDGLNEEGLALGFHFVNRVNPWKGLICTTLARMVLDTCATTEEAVSLLRELPHRQSFNYSIHDRRGKSAVVEASPRGVQSYQSDFSLVCANHFQSPDLLAENRFHIMESKERLGHLNDMMEGPITLVGGFESFHHEESRIFKKDYEKWNGTIHTIAFDCRNLSAVVGLGSGSRGVAIDFSKWLKGETLRIKKIVGKFPATEVFHFMEREKEPGRSSD
ncbi:C45 family autoproteolytic acyltransferase/hydrolase [Rossellomorea marisflavi]|uniref:C45 family autoproteolytic acyltransferase/hydolase n=1 Tax=Rossellomorea marisflavi TaxID=189381 RepID=UPI0025AFEAA9|nr:C45 family peptidase [Rossellomorea marisflavi]WJV20928.1 C45 family autoproteolytic acyltransferase/hydrolase [Rossellomorea marisflavi]